jgi:hypothetical protein
MKETPGERVKDWNKPWRTFAYEMKVAEAKGIHLTPEIVFVKGWNACRRNMKEALSPDLVELNRLRKEVNGLLAANHDLKAELRVYKLKEKHMKDCNYIPNGDLQGDTKGMPDRGTSTGMNGDSYDADLGQDSTNRIVGIGGATKSDSED